MIDPTLPSDGAFLALWNDVDPAKAAEYDVWHTIEHVPERVSIPGIRSARRYCAGGAPLHDYFTLYEVEDLAALAAAPYRSVVAKPTPWTLSMRPFLRNFLRQPCRGVMRVGHGLGGTAATIRFQLSPAAAEAAATIESLRERLTALPGLVAARLGLIIPDPTFLLANMPAADAGPGTDPGAAFVLVIEGLPAPGWRPAVGEIARWLEQAAGASAVTAQAYDLAFAVDKSQVDPTLWRKDRLPPAAS